MAERVCGFPSSEYLQRFDGSLWRLFSLNHGAVIITECGLDLIKSNPGIKDDLFAYRREVQIAPPNPIQRITFRHGGNSDVYQLGELPIVMKEQGGPLSVWSALDRMDYLYTLCERFMPQHIRVPKHYGAVFSSGLRRQYLLMEMVNDGMTIEDVLTCQEVDPEFQEEIRVVFQESKRELDLMLGEHSPERNLLPDWHEGNVIVDTSKPTDSKDYTLWVIDQ